MKNLPVLALVGFIALAACNRSTDPARASPAVKINPGTTLTEPTSDTPTGQADAEQPQTGTNTGRPDSPKDLKPGTDGNTNPPPRP